MAQGEFPPEFEAGELDLIEGPGKSMRPVCRQLDLIETAVCPYAHTVHHN
jgi:hypothetical protein